MTCLLESSPILFPETTRQNVGAEGSATWGCNSGAFWISLAVKVEGAASSDG